MDEQLFYVFNLKNTQEDYAQCLEFIEMMENLRPEMDDMLRLASIKSIIEKIDIAGGKSPRNKMAKRYFEVPLKVAKGSLATDTEPLIKHTKPLMIANIKKSILKYAGNNIFHVRIHFSYEKDGSIQDLPELRHLALLLQRLNLLINEKYAAGSRISVFIVPASATEYPFVDENGIVEDKTYRVVSAYLRLISKAYTGTIYGVCGQASNVTVQALDFKSAPRFTNLFPLTPIEPETYEKLFNHPIPSTDFDLLLTAMKRGSRFRNATSEQPNIAFNDYLLEVSSSILNPILKK